MDTSFLIDFDAGDEDAERMLESLVDKGEPLIIPTIVAAEFLTGMAKPEEALAGLANAGDVQDFSPEDAIATALVARKLFKKGVFPGWTDAMIAGFAKSRGDLPILTGNPKHFPESRTVTY